jgi:hypothetical protein
MERLRELMLDTCEIRAWITAMFRAADVLCQR